MTRLALIRHAPTPWNRAGQLQGRTDVSLDDAGKQVASAWALPPEMLTWRYVSSPLLRTRQTMERIIDEHYEVDERLIETNWAEWEGVALSEFREKYGDGADRDGLRGLDFCAPGGESPRQVQARVVPFLVEVAQRAHDTVVVTHKGVIRAVYALAVGWDMIDKPPTKLRNKLHLFRLRDDGMPVVETLNIPLEAD